MYMDIQRTNMRSAWQLDMLYAARESVVEYVRERAELSATLPGVTGEKILHLPGISTFYEELKRADNFQDILYYGHLTVLRITKTHRACEDSYAIYKDVATEMARGLDDDF